MARTQTRIPLALHLLLLLALCAAARADVTVGPGGDFATIQAGIDAALAGGGGLVQVAQGTYFEHLSVTAADLRFLVVSGGWLPGFERQAAPSWASDPSSPAATTIVHAPGAGPVVLVRGATRGSLFLEGFTFTGGLNSWAGGSCPIGGGLQIEIGGTAVVGARTSIVSGNEVSSLGECPAQGGGVGALLAGSSTLTLNGNIVRGNAAASTTNTATGGGIYISGQDTSVVRVSTNVVEDNEATSDSEQASGGGLFLSTLEPSTGAVDAVVNQNSFHANRVSGNSPCVGGCVWIGTGDRVRLRANRWHDNDHDSAAQLSVITSGSSSLEWGDDEIAGGARGATLEARDDSSIDVTNLTVADHSGSGLEFYPVAKGRVSLYNSIVYRNGVDADLPGYVALGNNLIGVNPRFADPDRRHYDLQPGSIAIDAGDDTPPAGLGTVDVSSGPRVLGSSVDIGAQEASGGAVGASGRFCRVDRFGEIPVPATVPVCSCLRDDVSRNLLCGFHFPEFFAEVRVPFPVVPGVESKAEWTLHPWGPGEAPFEMKATLLIDGKEIPTDGKGLSGKLRQGKDERAGLRLPGVSAPGVLRTVIRHLPAGAKVPIESLAEVATETSAKPK